MADETPISSAALSVTNFAGPFLLCAVFTLLAIALDVRQDGCREFIRRCCLRFGSGRKAHETLASMQLSKPKEDEPDLRALISDLSGQLTSALAAVETLQCATELKQLAKDVTHGQLSPVSDTKAPENPSAVAIGLCQS